MARKTKEESQLTRERILDAAEQVFSRRGVASATIAHIADTAGMSRGAVYGHYRNKVDICLAMCRRAYRRAAMPLEFLQQESVNEGLYLAGMHALRQYLVPGSMQKAVDVLYFKCECRSEHQPLLNFRSQQERLFKRTVRRLVRRGMEKGELPYDLNLDVVFTYVNVAITGIYHLHHRYGSQEGFWEHVEIMLRIGVEGLHRSLLLRPDAETPVPTGLTL